MCFLFQIELFEKKNVPRLCGDLGKNITKQ